jgi:hypothetical protein
MVEVLLAIKPLKLTVAIEPGQIVGCDAPDKVGAGFTVTVEAVEGAVAAQVPFFTMALNCVVVVTFEYVKEVVVFATVVQVVPLVEDSHRITFPVCSLNVKVPLLLPAQTVVPAETVPPTAGGSTVIVAGEEIASAQTPF